MACLEAMAVGLPVICLDLGGPASQVTEATGFKVPAIAPAQVVNDLTQAMLWLARHPDRRKRMGEAAQKRVAEYFDWDKKAEWTRDVYREVLDRRHIP
jgi:glycosyltransferase involved in cell wall biosynthesis